MPQQPATNQANDLFLWRLVLNNVPLVLFLALAIAGMMALYIFLSPQATSPVQAAHSSPDMHTALAAPIMKPMASRLVAQRFAQSPPPMRIGIIAGHLNNDPGAVCADGLTEVQVNLDITLRVAEQLRAEGVRVMVLGEFDPRLAGYTADALISIHADSCVYYNDEATGYKISPSPYTDSTTLYDCLVAGYEAATNLPFHANTITPHMTDYHAFREIGLGTPAVIIETGFMNLDRELLTTNANIPAAGIADGLFCFLRDSS
jgi:N-acetylmuramoyl-L-alanine amidase